MKEKGDIYCALWEKTRVLAQDHGLEMSPLCPMKQVCTGETCIFLEPIKETAENLGKFYEKLEKHKVQVKLAELRIEIDRMKKEEPREFDVEGKI